MPDKMMIEVRGALPRTHGDVSANHGDEVQFVPLEAGLVFHDGKLVAIDFGAHEPVLHTGPNGRVMRVQRLKKEADNG